MDLINKKKNSLKPWIEGLMMWKKAVPHEDAMQMIQERLKAYSIVSLQCGNQLSDFFHNIENIKAASNKNDLYRIIINSIIWYRDGDNIGININFK